MLRVSLNQLFQSQILFALNIGNSPSDRLSNRPSSKIEAISLAQIESLIA